MFRASQSDDGPARAAGTPAGGPSRSNRERTIGEDRADDVCEEFDPSSASTSRSCLAVLHRELRDREELRRQFRVYSFARGALRSAGARGEFHRIAGAVRVRLSPRCSFAALRAPSALISRRRPLYSRSLGFRVSVRFAEHVRRIVGTRRVRFGERSRASLIGRPMTNLWPMICASPGSNRGRSTGSPARPTGVLSAPVKSRVCLRRLNERRSASGPRSRR